MLPGCAPGCVAGARPSVGARSCAAANDFQFVHHGCLTSPSRTTRLFLAIPSRKTRPFNTPGPTSQYSRAEFPILSTMQKLCCADFARSTQESHSGWIVENRRAAPKQIACGIDISEGRGRILVGK